MSFSDIFQLKDKKFWWMDVIFYFVVSLLVASIFCYFIFLVKNNDQRKDIQVEIAALKTVSTEQQKEQEAEVINYQKKINDFANLLKNHEFASNVFAFMQKHTMSNVWFKQFGLDKKNGVVQLYGESDNMDAFSRQVTVFEGNEYVKGIGALTSSSAPNGKIQFSMNLSLNQKIFSYISDLSSISQTTTPSAEQNQNKQQENNQQQSEQGPAQNSDKLITAFHLLLNPEVVGSLNQASHTITLEVPNGTDVKRMATSVEVSSLASVEPASGVAQDFTNPVIYNVTAQDGSIQSYRVIVNIAPEEKVSFMGLGLIGVIGISVGMVLIIIALAVFIIWRKKQQYEN